MSHTLPHTLPHTLSHAMPHTMPHALNRKIFHSTSGQKVTTDELVNDAKFVQIVLSNKCITGPEAAEMAMQSGGRMPDSVPQWVVRKAANIILHADAKYYEDDFSKIPARGRDFVKK